MKDLTEYIVRVKELSPQVHVREARREDGNLFVSLFNKYYKRKTNLNYFHWQFFDSPFVSRLFMAFDETELIGFYGIKLYPLNLDIVSGFAVDFLIDEAYRKKGIAFLLEYEVVQFCLAQRVGLLTALPNAHGNAAFKSLGWKSLAKVDTLVKQEFVTSMDTQNEDSTHEVPLTEFLKDHVFRKWRFFENPLYKYEQIQLDEDTFAITKLFTDPVTGSVYGDIVDLKYKKDGKSLNAIMQVVLKSLSRINVGTVTTWALEHTPEYDFFLRLGFRPLPQERYFCVKILNSNLGHLNQTGNWRLVESDAEIF